MIPISLSSVGDWVRRPGVRRGFAAALVLLVVLYGALLRFDAITLSYGPVVRPAWMRRVQQAPSATSLLRPVDVTWAMTPLRPHQDGSWTRYTSDAHTYLQYAREMRSFYGAHYREPVFPFTTWVFLQLLKNQDVAVSFASAAYSVLAIFATYLLGACAFSRVVGLGAALAVAVEYDMISAGISGLRDDAFVCAVLLTTWAFVRYSRAPTRRNAVLIGILAGLACLVRIFAVLFIVPGLAYLWLTDRRSWRERFGGVRLAAVTAIVIVAPYLFNCWLVLGDPLPAFNVHADVYGAAEGKDLTARRGGTAGYIWNEVRSHPIQVADDVAIGLTTYPFQNKWHGFDRWIPGSGKWLSGAALVGLFLFAGSRDTRLFLLVLVTSLLPFAFKWKIGSDWRFTQHAYPLFLIAATSAISQILGVISPSRRHAPPSNRSPMMGRAFWGVQAGMVTAAVGAIALVLPVLTLQESLRLNQDATIQAGRRDWAFFRQGWSPPDSGSGVSWRVSRGPVSIVDVPLPRVQDYSATVRLDPFPGPSGDATPPLAAVRVTLNNQPLATLDLKWNPERIGAYELHLPSNLVREGMNRIRFVVEPRPGSATAIRLWLVRLRLPRA